MSLPPLAPTVPPVSVNSVLVVGAGLAGLRTVQALRARGFDGHITVIGQEPHAPYDRPPLSKQLFANDSPVFLAQDLGADINVLADQFITTQRAVALERSGNGWSVTTVSTSSGSGNILPDDSAAFQQHVADVVVLALGASPIQIPQLQQARSLHTWQDAVELKSELSSLARETRNNAVALRADEEHAVDLAIVGAGWIGMELASAARSHGLSVTIVEGQDFPLERHLGAVVGERMAAWCAQSSVNLLGGCTVSGLEQESDSVTVLSAVRSDGSDQYLRARVVVSAIGARPATAWVPELAARAANGALLTDSSGRVRAAGADPLNGLYAVGDCAERTDEVTGAVPGGHWDVALNDPERIALDLTGLGNPVRVAAPHVFSTQFGNELNLFGVPDLGSDSVVFRDYSEDSWTALYLRSSDEGPANPLVSAVLTVNAPKDASQARRLLANGAFSVAAGNLTNLTLPLKAL